MRSPSTPLLAAHLILAVCFWIVEGRAARIDPRQSEVNSANSSAKDALGDVLPEKALVRFGTARFRPSGLTGSVAYSPNGKFVASSSDYSREVRLWNAATGEEEAMVDASSHPQQLQQVLFSPNGRSLIYFGSNNGLYIWDMAIRRSSQLPIDAYPIAISADSRLLAGGGNRQLLVFDLKDRRLRLRLDTIKVPIRAIAFSPDGKLVATGEEKAPSDEPSVIRLWDTSTGKQVGELAGHRHRVHSLSFSSDGKVLASATPMYGAISRLWNVAERKQIATLSQASAVLFSPKGKLLATLEHLGTIHLYDSETYKEIRSIYAPGSHAMAFSPDGKKLLTGGAGALHLWDVVTGKDALHLPGHNDAVLSIQFSPDGTTLASYGDDLTVRLWSLNDKKERRRLSLGTRDAVWGSVFLGGGRVRSCSLAFSPDGKTLAAIAVPKDGEAGHPLPIWDVASGRSIAVIQAPRRKNAGARPEGLAFSPDGKFLASANLGSIQLWSPTTARQIRTFSGSEMHPLMNVAFSPDSRTLATVKFGEQMELELWDWTIGRPMRAFPTSQEIPSCLVFSPGGHILASTADRVGERDQTSKRVQLHEPATGTLLRIIKLEASSAACIAFSPNGRLLASAGQHDNAVHIWDALTGKELAKFTGHRGPVYCVAFSPDGKTVASGSADTTILLWDVSKLQPEQPPAIPQNELPKELAQLWKEMQAKEASKAYDALWRLMGAGDEAVAFLGQKLRPIPAPDAKLLNQAIADLDSNDFDKREAGTAHLTKLGELAEPALKQALQGQPSLEARKRMENLLAELTERSFREVKLSQIRALHALELIGSPAARELLKKLGGGAAGARLTRDAKLALQRLERLTNKP